MITNQELNAVFKMAHCVVMPYKSASQTGIAPTAFLFGKPIIASKVGALPDVVKHNLNGLLVDPNDAVAFAMAIKSIVDNQALLDSLSKGTLRFGVGDDYDWNNIAKDTITFFEDVIKN